MGKSAHVPKIWDAPIIDFGGIEDPTQRSILVEKVGNACRRHGFFQVVNHGINEAIVEGALSVGSGFLKLGNEEKARLMSSDVHKPVRYGSSLRDGVEFWRVFLKHYAHPLQQWIHMWPDYPTHYREKMGEYVVEVEKLAQKIMGVIGESVGLGREKLSNKMEEGMQVMAVNGYPRCPHPHPALGLPPHTDYCCVTLLLQDSPGLQILDRQTDTWMGVPVVEGALQVHVGDQLEVLTNGLYKSVLHRVVLSSHSPRISIAALHALGMDVPAQPQPQPHPLLPALYRKSTFRDFLHFISNNHIGQGNSFLDTLRINSI